MSRVSVIVCTRNRSQSLWETLKSLQESLRYTELQVDLVVVDNASTDNTQAVVIESQVRGLPVRILNEPKPGKSFALNRGVAEAKGDVILFTDDDVRVPDNWVERMSLPILDGSVDALQGNVILPSHLARRLPKFRCFFGVPENLHAEQVSGFVGANMAFHRKVLDKVPEFDTELGPGALGFGEETLFSLQLKIAGFNIRGETSVSVEHHFDPSRIERKNFLRTVYQCALSAAYIDYHWKHAGNSQSNIHFLKRLQLGLFMRRIYRFYECGRRDLCAEWEKEKVEWIAVYDFLGKSAFSPRKYEKYGLLKIC